MRKTRLILAAVLLAAAMIRPQAEGTIDTAGIEFDFNQDGITDQADWDDLQTFVKNYKLEDEDRVYYARQEVPATIGFLLTEYYGNRQTEGYGIDVSGVPEYYLPSLGLTTTVKDQNPFGTCWAFGSLAALESNLLLQRSGKAGTIDPAGYQLNLKNASDEINLSELYLAYEAFSPATGSQNGEGTVLRYAEEGNDRLNLGGFATSSQQLLTSWEGVLTEEMEPYEPAEADEDGAVIYRLHNEEETDAAAVPPVHVQKFIYLSSPDILSTDLEQQVYVCSGRDDNAVELMKEAMVKYGALMLSYEADMSRSGEEGNSDYTNYQYWAQYDDRNEMSLNHMVSIVGWNDNYPKENFQSTKNSLPPGDGAFLVKNSWGTYDSMYEELGEELVETLESYKGTEYEIAMNRAYNYGIPDENGHGSGYFWLSYYDHSIMGVCALAADDGADGFDYDHIYQYDLSRQFSSEQSVLPTDNEETKTANVFTAEGDERLDAVSVYAPQAGCTAEIAVYAVSDEGADVASGAILAEQTVSFTEKGFHTVTLDSPVWLKAGQKFAVAEKVLTEHDGRTIAWLNLENTVREDLQTEDNIGKLIARTVSAPGESYAYVKCGDGYVWTDIDTLNSETDASQIFTFGNALIKAYTVDDAIILVGPDYPAPAGPANYIPLYVLAGAILAAVIYLLITNKNR